MRSLPILLAAASIPAAPAGVADRAVTAAHGALLDAVTALRI